MRSDELDKNETADAVNLTRHNALKLAGVVASLGAGLGVVLETRDARAATLGQLQVKVYNLGDKGDEANAELIATYQPSVEEEKKIAGVRQGKLQLKFYVVQTKGVDGRVLATPKNTMLVKQIVPLDPAMIQGKWD